MSNGYTKSQAAEATGLPPRMVQFYTEEGLVVPEVENRPGRGRVRKYSQKNLLEFLVLEELHKYKLAISGMGLVMAALRDKKAFNVGSKMMATYCIMPKMRNANVFDLSIEEQSTRFMKAISQRNSHIILNLSKIFKKVEKI